MIAQNHVIHKQTLEFTLRDKKNLSNFQQRLDRLYHTNILPDLDKLFSALTDPETIIRLGKVEIDLGTISVDNLENEVTEKVTKYLNEELSNRIHHIHEPSHSQEKISETRNAISGSVTSLNTQRNDRIISQETSLLELLRHFLRTGIFPWWADKHEFASLEKIVAELITSKRHAMKLLLKEELSEEKSRHRLIYQFSDSFLLDVVTILMPEKGEQVQDWISDFHEIYKKNHHIIVSESEYRLFLWDALLKALISLYQKTFNEKEIFYSFFQIIAKRENIAYPGLLSSIQKTVEGLSESHFTFKSNLPHVIEILLRDESDIAEAKNEEIEKQKTDTEILKEFPAQTYPRQQLADKQPDSEEDLFTQGISIENAGLVILWPYFSPFFKNVGLIQESKFINETAIMQAIHLLQYLVTGEEETPENFLTLNKLLCGWDITKPVSKAYELSSQEQSESEKLLTTVISHWSALKNTSVKGFRPAFLQREGMLVKKEKNWLLMVERKAYDLLLDRLPWTISIIKLSWMKTLLYVEW
jgi:hypothetical protein